MTPASLQSKLTSRVGYTPTHCWREERRRGGGGGGGGRIKGLILQLSSRHPASLQSKLTSKVGYT